MNKTNLHHFASKMYLVTFERTTGLGCKKYGIIQVFNKPQTAHKHLKKLIEENDKLPFYEKNKIEYNLKTVDLNSPLTTELFEYIY